MHVDPMCLMSPTEQAYEGKKKTQNHTRCLPRLCYQHPSLCFSGCVREEKQYCPTEAQHYNGEESERGAWKEEGLVVFRPVCLFPSDCVGRPSEAHRHAIPSPTNIVVHQSFRGNTDGRGGRAEGH